MSNSYNSSPGQFHFKFAWISSVWCCKNHSSFHIKESVLRSNIRQHILCLKKTKTKGKSETNMLYLLQEYFAVWKVSKYPLHFLAKGLLPGITERLIPGHFTLLIWARDGMGFPRDFPRKTNAIPRSPYSRPAKVMSKEWRVSLRFLPP
jgi:hypothetical protein